MPARKHIAMIGFSTASHVYPSLAQIQAEVHAGGGNGGCGGRRRVSPGLALAAPAYRRARHRPPREHARGGVVHAVNCSMQLTTVEWRP
jgi:hypothetical protein